jgi:D-threo-aldose 1-dehydrogenase
MVSAIGFGTSGLGSMPDTYGYAVDEERARATLRAIFESRSISSIPPAITGTGAARSGSVRRSARTADYRKAS